MSCLKTETRIVNWQRCGLNKHSRVISELALVEDTFRLVHEADARDANTTQTIVYGTPFLMVVLLAFSKYPRCAWRLAYFFPTRMNQSVFVFSIIIIFIVVFEVHSYVRWQRWCWHLPTVCRYECFLCCNTPTWFNSAKRPFIMRSSGLKKLLHFTIICVEISAATFFHVSSKKGRIILASRSVPLLFGNAPAATSVVPNLRTWLVVFVADGEPVLLATEQFVKPLYFS